MCNDKSLKKSFTMVCPYCPIENDHDNKIIFRNDIVLYVENEKYQGALRHSGIIIPVKHRRTVFELTQEEIIATFELLKTVKSWMDDNFQPDGYNIGWNCERVGGQEVLHAHMHVIPRFKDEPLSGEGIRSLLKSDKNLR